MIEAVAMTAPAGLVEELRSDPEVESIRLDEVLVLVPAPSEAQIESAPNWNIQMLRAPELWDLGLRGQGVVVATLDSGVDPNHSDLKHKWRGGGNSWLDPHGEHAEPHDRSGHGTQAMGIIVGGDAGGQAIGIAPGAQWIAAKIFSDGGLSSFSVIHEAFQWVLDPDGDPLTDDAPAVVVCPWGIAGSLNQCNPEFNDDVQVLRAAGIAVVFPSGNDGPGFRTSSAPANTPGSLAVGAVDRWMNLAPFSSRGPSPCGGEFYPQLTAPGVGIRTSDLTAGGLFPEATATVSGTSFAAPHVGGALALLKSAFPAVPIEQIESSLLRSGLDGGTPGPDHGFGFGVVDVLAAHGELLAGLACTDSDGDGFYAEPGCGSPLDCNDSDPAVHPGAVDLARDGIDQDCSGFDLSIVVRRAVCSSRSGILQIVASSELKGDAQLSVEGFGAMEYRRGKNWSGRFREVQTCPTTVVVTGHEGSLAASVRVRPRR